MKNKPNRTSIVLILLICFASCSVKNGETTVFFFDRHYFKTNNLDKEAFKHSYRQMGSNNFQLEVYNDSGLVEHFPIQVLKEKGIYQDCDKHLHLLYSFDTTVSTSPCKSILPHFKTKSIKYVAKKNYIVNKSKYVIWCFAETGEYDRIFFSYYVENIGFVCFCDISEGDYFVCNKVDGDKYKFIDIKSLSNVIVNDKTFFGNFIIKKEEIDYTPPEK
jgi:hypothetical protein